MTVPQRGDHELSRIYSEGAWPEPNRQIDEAILEASRRAARARHPVLHRWGPPVALAATVILGISLALLVTDNESTRDASRLLRSGEPAATHAAPQKKREAAPPASRPEAAPKTEAAPNVVAPPLRELFASPMGSGEAKPAAKAAPPAAGPAPAKRPAPPAAAKSPAPPAARAVAPDPQRAERIRRDLEQLDEKRETRAALPVPRPAEAPASASVSDVRALAAPVARSPEAWLDDIRKLKSDGRSADAERELADFRRRYPEYRVPDDLR